MKNKLERTTFETSRAAEYFSRRELSAMTGQPPQNFASVAVKELVDNSLDACEAAGAAPEITIRAEESASVLWLTVTDNGGGISSETVEKILNFTTRTSDKAAYRSPTRGAQGNALKTVLGIPHALGMEEPVIIEAHGVRHEIRAWTDPAGELRIERDESSIPETTGTRVSLALPTEGQDFDAPSWAASFAAFNPHARIVFEPAQFGSEQSQIYKYAFAPTTNELKKYQPADPTAIHWYSTESLKRLVFSHISHARGGGRDLPVGEFVRQFRGLSSSAKAKQVLSSMDGIKRLSDFDEKPEAVETLLLAMADNSKEPPHAFFGVVGEDHFRAFFEDAYSVKEFNYRKVKGYLDSGLAYIFEFALAITQEQGDLYTAINYSPTFGDPLEGTRLVGPEFAATGIKGFLEKCYAAPGSSVWGVKPANTAAAAHIITPAPQYMDRGKTRIQMQEA